jgi:inner membrane protein
MAYLMAHLPAFWFAAGILLILAELMIPGGFVMLLLGLGALTVSLVTWVIPMSLFFQLFLFAIASLMYTFLLKENLKAVLRRKQDADDPESEFKGKIGKALTSITDKEGKVDFKGTQWPAKSESPIAPGEEVEILDLDSITLLVKSHKK